MPVIGELVGNYRILDIIGSGGMGQVFRGREELLEREVAIKALRPELTQDAEVLERFRLEARTLSRLNHPNIVMLYNFFQQDDRYYMVMEYAHGESLADFMRHYPDGMPWRLAIHLIGQALSALEYAHSKGIIHRDIKPANLMVQSNRMLKVMDFGVARILGTHKLTRTGFMVGTLKYMSPEQILCRDDIDGHSDQYSTALVLYEMLCGRSTFDESSEYEMIRRQVEMPPPSLRDRALQVPPKLEALIMRALSKKPQDRFGSAWEFQQLLESVVREDSPWDESTRVASHSGTPSGSFPAAETPSSLSKQHTVVMSNPPSAPAPSGGLPPSSPSPPPPEWVPPPTPRSEARQLAPALAGNKNGWLVGAGLVAAGLLGAGLVYVLNKPPPLPANPAPTIEPRAPLRESDDASRQEIQRMKAEIATLKKAVEESHEQIKEQSLEAARNAKHFGELAAAAPSENKRLEFQASKYEAEYEFDLLTEVEIQYMKLLQGEQGVRSLDAALATASAALEAGKAGEASQSLAQTLEAWRKIKAFPDQARQRQREEQDRLFGLIDGYWGVDNCGKPSTWMIRDHSIHIAWPKQALVEERILAVKDNYIYTVADAASPSRDIFRYRVDGNSLKAENTSDGRKLVLKKCRP